MSTFHLHIVPRLYQVILRKTKPPTSKLRLVRPQIQDIQKKGMGVNSLRANFALTSVDCKKPRLRRGSRVKLEIHIYLLEPGNQNKHTAYCKGVLGSSKKWCGKRGATAGKAPLPLDKRLIVVNLGRNVRLSIL